MVPFFILKIKTLSSIVAIATAILASGLRAHVSRLIGVNTQQSSSAGNRTLSYV